MLVVCPSPFPDECLAGYLRRVSEANGFADRNLRKVLASFDGAPPPLSAIAQALRRTHRGLGTLAGMTPDTLLAKRHRADVQFTTGAIQGCCPLCLREAPYWRAHWSHVLVSHCPVHRTRLQRHCGQCGAAIRSVRTELLRCDCGSLYASLPSGGQEAGPAAVIPLQALVGSKVLGQEIPTDAIPPHWPTAITGLSPAQLSQLILFLGTYAHTQGGQSRRKLALKLEPATAEAIVAAAAETLDCWPAAWERALDQSMSNSYSQKLSAVYGPVYDILYSELRHRNFGFLRKAFEGYLVRRWAGTPIDRRNRKVRVKARKRQRYIPAPRVLARYSVRRAELEAGVVSGHINGRITALPSGRKRIEISRRSLKKLASTKAPLDLRGVANQLGIARRRVRELLTAGVIKGNKPGLGHSWNIPALEGIRLLRRLRAIAAPTTATVDLKSIPELFRLHGGDSLSAADLLSAVLSREVPVWRTPAQGLAGILVSRGELVRWADQRRTSLSVVEAALSLGVKQEAAYHWVRTGIIPSVDYSGKGKRISLVDLAMFRRKFVLASHLARADRTSSRAVMARLEKKGVYPVSGPGIDGGRQAIFERMPVAAISERWQELVSRCAA